MFNRRLAFYLPFLVATLTGLALMNGCAAKSSGFGSSPPTAQSSGSGSRAPQDWQTGTAIYVATNLPQQGDSVLVFSPHANGNVAPIRGIGGAATMLGQLPPPINYLTGLAVDNLGLLYVGFGTFTEGGAVFVFPKSAQGNVPPVFTIKGPNTKLMRPNGIDVDNLGHLYVATNHPGSQSSGEIAVFNQAANNDPAPIRQIFPIAPAVRISALAVGPQFVYSATTRTSFSPILFQTQSIDVYPQTANGPTTPICRMTGPKSGISATTQIEAMAAVRVVNASGSGTVWAALFTGGFGPSSLNAYEDCVSKPVAVISGPNTGVVDPAGIAVDGEGFLYEVDNADSSVRVWAPGHQNGNVAPNFIIKGPNTHLGLMWGIAIGPGSALVP